MRTGWRLLRARRFVMAIGAAVLPAAIFAPFVPSAAMAIAATCFITFGHALWVANLQTLPTDLFDQKEIGTATGFSGMGGAVGGIFANLGTGWVVTHFSYPDFRPCRPDASAVRCSYLPPIARPLLPARRRLGGKRPQILLGNWGRVA